MTSDAAILVFAVIAAVALVGVANAFADRREFPSRKEFSLALKRLAEVEQSVDELTRANSNAPTQPVQKRGGKK